MQIAASRGIISAMDRPIGRRSLLRPVMMGVAVAIVVLAASVWWVLNPAEATLSVQAAKIAVATVRAAPFHDFIPLRGEAEPLASVVLDVAESGRVEAVLAEPGQRIVVGQPLLRLSNPSLELEAIAREAQIVEQMNAQRAQQLTYESTRTSDLKAIIDAEYNILRLSRQVARRRSLASKGFASQETLDQSADELAYHQRLRQLAIDGLQRDAAVINRSTQLFEEMGTRLVNNLAAVKHQLEALTVRAPADGVLTGFDVHVGEQKAQGQHLGQIDRDSGFKVTAQLDEFYLPRVKLGQKTVVTIGGTLAALTATKLYPQIKDRRFRVDLAWKENPPPGLRRGQTIQGKLELDDDDVPSSLLPTGPFLEASGGAWVFVLNRDGTSARRRSIKLGRRTSETVEVLDGLAPGDRVVISDYTGLDHIERLAISP